MSMHKQTKRVINRLARIEGHIKAIKNMVQEGKSCKEVLLQLLAVKKAIISVSKVILIDHIENCSKSSSSKKEFFKAIDELKEIIISYLK